MTSPGRLEVVSRQPLVLLDGAHNPAGARALAAALLEEFVVDRRTLVVACLADKDIRGILDGLAPATGRLIVTTNHSPAPPPRPSCCQGGRGPRAGPRGRPRRGQRRGVARREGRGGRGRRGGRLAVHRGGGARPAMGAGPA